MKHNRRKSQKDLEIYKEKIYKSDDDPNIKIIFPFRSIKDTDEEKAWSNKIFRLHIRRERDSTKKIEAREGSADKHWKYLKKHEEVQEGSDEENIEDCFNDESDAAVESSFTLDHLLEKCEYYVIYVRVEVT